MKSPEFFGGDAIMFSKAGKIGISMGVMAVMLTVVCLLGIAGMLILCRPASDQTNKLGAIPGCLAGLNSSVSEGSCLSVSANKGSCSKQG